MLGQLIVSAFERVSAYWFRAKLDSIVRDKLDPAIDPTYVVTILVDNLLDREQIRPVSFNQLKRDTLAALGRHAHPGAFFYAYQWLKEHNVIQIFNRESTLYVCLNLDPNSASDQTQPIVAHLQRFTN